MTSSIDVAICHCWPLDGISVALYYNGRPIEITAHTTGGLHNSGIILIKNVWEKSHPVSFQWAIFQGYGIFLCHSPPPPPPPPPDDGNFSPSAVIVWTIICFMQHATYIVTNNVLYKMDECALR